MKQPPKGRAPRPAFARARQLGTRAAKPQVPPVLDRVAADPPKSKPQGHNAAEQRRAEAAELLGARKKELGRRGSEKRGPPGVSPRFADGRSETGSPAPKSSQKAEDPSPKAARYEKQIEAMRPYRWQKGQSGNPAGSEKGVRRKFSETFLKDFLADWEQHGAQALKKCREVDPAAYVKVAASLLPKDFNVTHDEAAIETFLDKFNDKELQDLARGLSAVGRGSREKVAAQKPGNKPDSVH